MYVGTSKIESLIATINSQFNYRTITEFRKHGLSNDFKLEITIDNDNVLWLTFYKQSERHNVTIPLPFMKNGVEFIQQNEVTRAVCPFWLEQEQHELDYLGAIFEVLLGTPSGLIPDHLIKATPYLQQVIYGLVNNNVSIIVYKLQKAINEIVNKMPLDETPLNSFIMNNRLMIIDPAYDDIQSPTDRLKYQKEKAIKYFGRGWTVIGLSDNGLADKNYILKTDIRKLSPFGIKYHNPQRNLYSTLGMKGEELPIIRSQSMQELINKGITRKGWNLFTAFVDIPDIFEDQIIMDESFKDKFVEYDKRFQVFGKLCVKTGQKIKRGDILGIAPDDEPIKFNTVADSAEVSKISDSVISVGGNGVIVHNIMVTYRRNFIDGFKMTNLHGNKGVVRLKKLGYAIDPRTGQTRKIDVIVGAKTVGKRKNFGQIMEALTNSVLGEKDFVLADDWYQPMEEVLNGLEKRGFRRDGTWDCDIYAGKVRAVCGKVFWGCISTPQDQIWGEKVLQHNGKEVRTAGLKFSHVEFRALETTFGVNNPVTDEIMSYIQGYDNVHEMLTMLKSKICDFPSDKPLTYINNVKPADQVSGTIIQGHHVSGTVVDEFFKADGFTLKLPVPYQTVVAKNGKILHEGSPLALDQMSEQQKQDISNVYNTDRLYFPSGVLRKCWHHPTGRYGLSEIGVIVNNVVTMCHRLISDYDNPVSHRLYYNSIFNYFASIAIMLGGKRGEISTHTMAVRYPLSAKAYATLSSTLPKNMIEIHRDMANLLRVKSGDTVLVERFPCLGFMSLRIQKVIVTDDPMCKYTIRASSNSLVSLNLDFDGDTLFIASLHTPEAKDALNREWKNPNITCYREIQTLNKRKGKPHVKEYSLMDFNIKPFEQLTCLEHAEIVEKNTGVKAQTGPVIALTYNVMRIVESSGLAKDQKMKVAVEMFLEKAAQSVFEQKHGGKSLYEIVIDGICTANVEMLVEVGFKRGTTEKLCDLIIRRAKALGIFDLDKFHKNSKENGWSNIVSKIVRQQNRIYFASRSYLEGTALIKALEEPAVDISSKMYKWATSGKSSRIKTTLDEFFVEDNVSSMKNPKHKDACKSLCSIIDETLNPSTPRFIKYFARSEQKRAARRLGGYTHVEICCGRR